MSNMMHPDLTLYSNQSATIVGLFCFQGLSQLIISCHSKISCDPSTAIKNPRIRLYRSSRKVDLTLLSRSPRVLTDLLWYRYYKGGKKTNRTSIVKKKEEKETAFKWGGHNDTAHQIPWHFAETRGIKPSHGGLRSCSPILVLIEGLFRDTNSWWRRDLLLCIAHTSTQNASLISNHHYALIVVISHKSFVSISTRIFCTTFTTECSFKRLHLVGWNACEVPLNHYSVCIHSRSRILIYQFKQFIRSLSIYPDRRQYAVIRRIPDPTCRISAASFPPPLLLSLAPIPPIWFSNVPWVIFHDQNSVSSAILCHGGSHDWLRCRRDWAIFCAC